MITHVLDLQNVHVGQITVPMSKLLTVSIQTPVSEVLVLAQERGFNRFPVWRMEGGRRRIIGVLSLRSLLFAENLDPKKTAGDFVKPAIYLGSEMRLEVALRQMQRSGQRLGIVLGRDRAEVGVISLQDILQLIFGEVKL